MNYHKTGQGQQDEIKVRTMDWATYQDWTKSTAVGGDVENCRNARLQAR